MDMNPMQRLEGQAGGSRGAVNKTIQGKLGRSDLRVNESAMKLLPSMETAEFICLVVHRLWPSSTDPPTHSPINPASGTTPPMRLNNSNMPTIDPALLSFVRRLLKSSGVAGHIMLLGLLYLDRLRRVTRPQYLPPGSSARLVAASVILAQKVRVAVVVVEISFWESDQDF